MSVTGDFFQFRGGELVAVDIALADNLTVADSFLVSAGTVRALDRHLNRFAASISDERARRQLPQFFREFLSLIPDSEDWFPRLEYRAGQPDGERLFVRMRPAPERTGSVTLWTLDEPDPRESPLVKGPDLSVCQRLRRKANLSGADEAVILDADGFIADGALSAIVWWQNDVLFAPDDSTPWLPSITRELVFELAQQAGYETQVARRKPEQLAGCEIWSLSALQGIRSVTSWGDLPLGQTRLCSPFQKRLALLAERLPEPDDLIAKLKLGSGRS